MVPIVATNCPTRRPDRHRPGTEAGPVARHRLFHGQQMLEPVLAQAVVERRAVDPERAGGVGDVPLRGVDGRHDGRPLLFVQPLAQRSRARVGSTGAGRRRCGGAGRRRPAGELQVVAGDLRAAGQDQRALDHVLQLADVPRPGVGAERGHRRGVDPAHRLAGAGRVLLQEVLGQMRDVARPIAQRREQDREDVQAVIEILSKRAVGDLLLEIAVGGRDDADVDLDRLGAAHPLELALLQHAQQLDLDVQRQVAHLVEEQRAAVGQLEAAEPPRDRPGEGPLLVAEQLRLEHAGGQRGAVDPHERARLAGAVDVDGARHHLLAGAGLAAQEDRRRGLRHLLDPRQHVPQRRRLADDGAEAERAVRLLGEHPHVGRELLLQAAVLAQQREALDGVGEHAAHLLGVPGLGDVAVDAAQVDRLDEDVDVGERGHDDPHRVGADLARGLQQIEAGHPRHPLVGDDHRHVLRARQRQRLFAAAGQQKLEGAAEIEPERVQVVGLVVDHQHRVFRQIQPLRHRPIA